jgi:putative Mg2+ transporter-C (MgtC) family protein
LIFICVGSTVFTILSWKIADARDPRIAATIVSGIGFLGAGVILRDRGRIVGITTAATIWLTAALGMAIGGGFYSLAINLLGAALIVLWLFPRIETWIDRAWEEKNYEMVCVLDKDREPQLRADFERHGLQVLSHQQHKTGDKLQFFWRVGGPRKSHEQLIRHLVSSPEIKEFHV